MKVFSEVSPVPGKGIVVTAPADVAGAQSKGTRMGYGIGGILITILVILAIIYFAKRV